MQIRFLKPDVAIIDGKWTIEGVHTPEGKDAPKELGVFSVVAVRQEGSTITAHLLAGASGEMTTASRLRGCKVGSY